MIVFAVSMHEQAVEMIELASERRAFNNATAPPTVVVDNVVSDLSSSVPSSQQLWLSFSSSLMLSLTTSCSLC